MGPNRECTSISVLSSLYHNPSSHKDGLRDVKTRMGFIDLKIGSVPSAKPLD